MANENISGTKVFGASDDLIEFRGDLYGECSAYLPDDESALISFSDGTVLKATFGLDHLGNWSLRLLHQGTLFDRIEQYPRFEDADTNSDIAYFKPGLKVACVATEWTTVSGERGIR